MDTGSVVNNIHSNTCSVNGLISFAITTFKVIGFSFVGESALRLGGFKVTSFAFTSNSTNRFFRPAFCATSIV